MPSATINVMEAAARKAARGLIRDFGEVENLQVSRKGPADFVTEADRRAERILRAQLAKARPGFGFLMEESGETEGEDTRRRWIVDPLDGTTNFLHGIPHFAISIGLEEDGAMVAGLVYDPLRDELFWAEKGVGCYLNRRRLRVSSRRRMEEAVLATGIPFKGRAGKDAFLATIGTAIDNTAGVRRFGSAALDLAYVAAGRYDGFWEFGLSPWDVAAGIVLVREAGGFVTDISGRAVTIQGASIVAANDRLHTPLRRMLGDSLKESVEDGVPGSHLRHAVSSNSPAPVARAMRREPHAGRSSSDPGDARADPTAGGNGGPERTGLERTMTNAERIVEALRRKPGLDDDELSRLADVTPRQQVNRICRRLEREGKLRRERGPRGKIVNDPVR